MRRRTDCRGRPSKAFLALLFLACGVGAAGAQPLVVSRHLSVEDGLSFHNVTALLLDRTGFLWVGTADGLTRHDGYEAAVFTARPGGGLADAYVNLQALLEDREGMIWVGTRGGLSRLDPRTGRVVSFRHDASDPCSLGHDYVTALLERRNGDLLVGTVGGLQRLDAERACFVSFGAASLGDTTGGQVQTLLEDHQGVLWAGYVNGLFRYDEAAGRLAPFTSTQAADLDGVLREAAVYDLAEDASGGLWAGTFGRGLFHIDAEREAVRQYRARPADEAALPDDRIMAVHAARDGAVWVGTYEGSLARLDPRTDRFLRYAHDPADPGSLSDHRVTAFAEEATGALWAGTWRGADRLAPAPPFRVYAPDPDRPASLSHAEVSAVAEDPSGLLWVGTSAGGLNRLDPATGEAEHLRSDGRPGSLASDRISSLFLDRGGALWVGTFGGLARLDRRTGRFRVYRHDPADPASLTSDLVYSVYEDRSGALWAGTVAAGLNRLDPPTGRFTRFLHDPADSSSLSWDMVWPVLEDRAGTLWVGTIGGGLARLDPETGRFTAYRHDPADPASLSHDRVVALGEDPASGDLWAGTMGGGLSRLDRSTGRFRRYGAADGLPHHNAVCLLPDDAGRLWVATGGGLARLDPGAERFRTYTTVDGLPGDDFFFNACTRARDGTLYFGTYRGLVAFHPDSLPAPPPPPRVVLTRFDLFNEPAPLDTAVTYRRLVRLRHDENFVGFHFAALAFEAPEAVRYAYRLEGIDADWNEVGARRYAGYPNLPPGTYTFRVRAAGRSGQWSEAEAGLRLVVAPPFWRTWWFRLLAAGLLAAMLYGGYRYRLHHEHRLERTRRRIADDLHDDIGGKMSSIALFLEVLSRKERVEAADRQQLSRLSGTARQLVGDLRDTVWIVDAGHDTLASLVARMRETAHAVYAGLHVRFEGPALPPAVPLDMERRRHLFLLYREALNNAARHAGASSVVVRVDYAAPLLTLRVADDGAGFEVDRVRAGRGLKTMRQRAEALGGTLRIESRPGEGTVVHFSASLE